MKYTFLALILIFAPLFATCVLGAESTIHFIIAADTDPVADGRKMERLFQENVPPSRLKSVFMKIDELTPDTLQETVNQVQLAEGDTLVLYYSGCETREIGNGGQYFHLKDKDGKPTELQRRTLLAMLLDKKAKLTVLLTDSCLIEQKTSDENEKKLKNIEMPEKMSPIFEALFVKSTGTVDIASAKWGEASFADFSSEKHGSCFMDSLLALFEKHRSDALIIWPDFVAELKTNVQTAFLEAHPRGYRFDPPLNGLTVQKTQTLAIYGLLPGEAKEFSPSAHQGPRFGVRAVNHAGSGVRVTQLVPAGPGARAGFTIGDVILEINGKPIRNEKDYSKAVDDSPKEMRAKVINAGDGRTINMSFELGSDVPV